MPNFVLERRRGLAQRHYLLLANQKHHWFNAYPRRVKTHRAKYGDSFCVVLWRSGDGDDAYVIPFAKLKELFVDKNLVSGPRKTLRWHGIVRNDQLILLGQRGRPAKVEGCHNAFHLLDNNGTTNLTREVAQATSAFKVPQLSTSVSEALCAQIADLEKGLKITDRPMIHANQPNETSITACDASGRTVVIAVIRGPALPESLKQLLSRMDAEHGPRPRGILLAEEFHSRTIRAAMIVDDVLLVRYQCSFMFKPLN